MALTNKLTAIADAIREKTGGTDPLTLDQMAVEIAGISGGGGGLAYDTGEIVFANDGTFMKNVPHSLGEVPDFVMVWTDDFAGTTNEYGNTTNLGLVAFRNLFGMPQRYSSALSGIGIGIQFTNSSGSNTVTPGAPNSITYNPAAMFANNVANGDITDTYFTIIRSGNSNYYRAGKTYKYFVSKAWWNVGGA